MRSVEQMIDLQVRGAELRAQAPALTEANQQPAVPSIEVSPFQLVTGFSTTMEEAAAHYDLAQSYRFPVALPANPQA